MLKVVGPPLGASIKSEALTSRLVERDVRVGGGVGDVAQAKIDVQKADRVVANPCDQFEVSPEAKHARPLVIGDVVTRKSAACADGVEFRTDHGCVLIRIFAQRVATLTSRQQQHLTIGSAMIEAATFCTVMRELVSAPWRSCIRAPLGQEVRRVDLIQLLPKRERLDKIPDFLGNRVEVNHVSAPHRGHSDEDVGPLCEGHPGEVQRPRQVLVDALVIGVRRKV